ncbi:MAG TPA: hypothetical protein VGG03_14220 [Thermoanaerobaculia bacterium]|jgi:hypothetical protein
MSLMAYKAIHIFSIMLLFTAFGGLLLAARAGVETGVSRKLAGITHGIALVLILFSGFGALAKIGLSNPAIWPAWLWTKALIWLAFGAVIVLIRRAPRSTPALWWILPLLGGIAAWLALKNPA